MPPNPLHARIQTENHLPTPAPLPSSPTPYPPLPPPSNQPFSFNLSHTHLSPLPPPASPSPSTTIFPPFPQSQKPHHHFTSYPHPINSNPSQKHLSIIFLVINNHSKKLSTTSPISLTTHTSTFYQYSLDHLHQHLNQPKQPVKNQDFQPLPELIQANRLPIHAT
ncbi:diphosphomevalonate/mevalonate 3,5-bisphosphate decarboxylase family protein, partial [Staphylococcus epidermidis]